MKLLKTFIEINFVFSVFLSIVGGFYIYNHPENFVSEDFRLYGPLGNNLLIVALLVALMQGLLLFFYFREGYKAAMAMGGLFLLIGFDLQIYSDTNQIDIDSILMYSCFYLGAAHILYFLSAPDA